VEELKRSLSGTNKLFAEQDDKFKYIAKAVESFPAVPLEMTHELKVLNDEVYAIRMQLYGDRTRASREFETEPGINDRLGYAAYSSWWNTAEPTVTAREQLSIAGEQYAVVLGRVQELTRSIANLEKRLVELNVPYTPGRGSDWRED
jgi:hypothetical protein